MPAATARIDEVVMTRANDRGSAAGDKRVFPLRDPPVVRPPVSLLVAACLFGSGSGALLGLAFGLRAGAVCALAFALGALAFFVARRRVRRVLAVLAARAARWPRVELDDARVAFAEGDERTELVPLDRRVGVTLFTSPSRADLVVALSHRDGVQYFSGRGPTGRVHLDVLARATTTPENDLPLGPQVPRFDDGDRLLELVAALEERRPGALERVVLCDAGMADVVLDGDRLRAAQQDFDLAAPLSWRAYAFQEGSSFASHSFQATHVRQGEREVVFVALSPIGELASVELIHPPGGHAGPLAFEPVQRALARDLRLARCLADVPPPRHARVAVDRLFVPRLRCALDRAPLEVVAPLSVAPPLVAPSPVDHDALSSGEVSEALRRSPPGPR